MTRRVLLIALIVLGLFAGRVLMVRGIHPALAAHSTASGNAAAAAGAALSTARTKSTDNLNPSPAASAAANSAAHTEETSSARSSNAVTSNFPSQPPAQQSPAIPDIDTHKAYGSKNAPVIMEVFSDYQCPACKALYSTTNRQIMDNYVTTGKVYLIHRDFPLPMHAHSKVAAIYARAAAHLGKSEAVEQVLFENQEKWEKTGEVDGTVATVLSPAEMAKVRGLVKGGTLDAVIAKDVALGQTYAVNQTPTTVFHAKGQTYPYAGVMNYEILKQFLEQLLSQK